MATGERYGVATVAAWRTAWRIILHDGHVLRRKPLHSGIGIVHCLLLHALVSCRRKRKRAAEERNIKLKSPNFMVRPPSQHITNI